MYHFILKKLYYSATERRKLCVKSKSKRVVPL